jgi:hypothetical protein
MLMQHVQRRKGYNCKDSNRNGECIESPVRSEKGLGYTKDVRSGAQHND